MTHIRLERKPFERSFNNLVEDLFSELPVIFKNDIPYSPWKGNVPVNIIEKDEGYSLEVVAPGFEKTDFKISLEQLILTISAEKKEDEKDGKKQIRKEYPYRSFKRSFTINDQIDIRGIDAQYVNGVLTLNLPKKEIVKETAKEINIR